ncbi:MAG: molybdopterin-guanine dinucleotide biosynthesis protein B [Candidatus Scalindua sp.]
MNSEDVTIISIVGKQNAGKTTLIKDLIPKLKNQGYRVGTLKYNIRKFDIDHEGKDTYKYYHSGADSVAISSQNEFVVMKKMATPPTLHEIIETHLNDVNIVLVEGYREDDYPRIRIIDSQETETVKKDSKNELLLIKENLKNRCFSIEDINKALNFIEKSLKIG